MTRRYTSGGGWPAIRYFLTKARGDASLLKTPGALWRMWKALRSRNACKTCALGMGGQLGGMVNEEGRFPEVCKKSIQAMAADMQGRIHEHFFDDFSLEALRGFSPRELEAAGRLVEPVYAGPLDSHYRRISWNEALDRIAARMAKIDPNEAFFYLSGRSSNEAAFLLQLFARLYGTNNVSNCSYYCHQASGVALTSVTGSGTATVQLADLEHTELIFIIGGNPASNHPRFMRTLLNVRRNGGKVVVINPIREIGLVRFNVPSDPLSLLFGSTISDEYLQPHIGGDIALLTGIAKGVLERGAADARFVAECSENWSAFERSIHTTSWERIVEASGVSRSEIERVAAMYARANSAIFCWTMGMTHHAFGVQNVQMIANLALMRGMVGKPHAGLLPLRGHSNVQGVGSMGVTPQLKETILAKLQAEFGGALPTKPGLDTLASMEAAAAGAFKFAWCLGGNLYGSNPDANFAAKALNGLDMVVYLNTTLNTGHAHGRGRETLILPVLARDEERQPTTQESMFNYVRLSDGGVDRYEGPRGEVEIIADVAGRIFEKQGRGAGALNWNEMRSHEAIRTLIARVVPGYESIASIDRTKAEFQIPGRTFHSPRFNTPSGRARFHAVELPSLSSTHADGEPSDRDGLRLMTIRSEGQFNTVVYEDEDVYRGQDRRDIIMMSRHDVDRLGLTENQRVTVRSACGALSNVLVRIIDIRPGNAAMYYPEANVIVPRRRDAQSKTPAFKSVMVMVQTASVPGAVDYSAQASATPANGTPRRTLQAC
jgi:molybdopterin-dependent oxidoreductase alpha subunit